MPVIGQEITGWISKDSLQLRMDVLTALRECGGGDLNVPRAAKQFHLKAILVARTRQVEIIELTIINQHFPSRFGPACLVQC